MVHAKTPFAASPSIDHSHKYLLVPAQRLQHPSHVVPSAFSECSIPLELESFTCKIHLFEKRARKQKRRPTSLPSVTIDDVVAEAAAWSSGNAAGPSSSSNSGSKPNGKDQRGRGGGKSKGGQGHKKGGGKGGKKGKGKKKK